MIYRFGSFSLDDSARELRREGRRVETEPKTFELLLYLVQHADRAVSKDELLSVLWPRQIVTETALSRSVMKARRAVDDDAGRQAFIRTLHGHGYRFVGDFEPAADAAPTEAAPLPPPPPVAAATARRTTRPGVVLATLLLLGLLVSAGWWLWRETGDPDSGPIAVLPVHDTTGDPELGWVRVGMMSLLSRMLEEGGLSVVPDRAVLDATSDLDTAVPPDKDRFAVVRERTQAAMTLHTTLDSDNGQYRVVAVLTRPDGRQARRIIFGKSPAGLAADLASVLAGMLDGRALPDEDRFAKVSADPFVNEMYARALDLELQGELAEARSMFELASAQEPELFWLRYEIALCTRDLREWDAATAQFAALYDDAIAGGDPRAVVATLNSRGIMYLRRNDYEAAAAEFVEALDFATERGREADRIKLLTNLALIETRTGDSSAARAHYDQLESEFERLGQPPNGYFLNNYAGLLLENGNLDSARSYAERAVEAFRLFGQRRHEAPALNRLARILREQGDLEGAMARHEQALAIYRDLGDTNGELTVLSALTGTYRARGDLTRARHNAADVLERVKADTDDALLLGDAYMQYGRVEYDLDDPVVAAELFDKADELYTTMDDALGIRSARTARALALLDTGATDTAAAIAGELLSRTLKDHNDAGEARARWLTGRVAEARGLSAEAAEAYASALAYARSANDQAMLVAAASRLAGLRLAGGELEAAAELVEEIRPVANAQLEFLRLDARLARARGEADAALAIVATLRNRAGEAWDSEDEALLQSLDR